MEEKLAPNNLMILEIRELLESARKNVAQQVNAQLLTTYWNIGRIIVEYEQQNQIRAEYGKQTLKELSRELMRESGKGCFKYPVYATLLSELSNSTDSVC